MGLPYEEFNDLFFQVKREALHLCMRDSYGTEVELPHLAKWKAGEPDDFAWLQWWCDLVRDQVATGRVFRRINLASEPLSEYHQWAYSVERHAVEAGQDIRWVPRRLVSELLFPGNDLWLIDDELVVFLHYRGSGLVTERIPTTDPAVIRRCRDSFEAAWPLGIPYRDYRPVV